MWGKPDTKNKEGRGRRRVWSTQLDYTVKIILGITVFVCIYEIPDSILYKDNIYSVFIVYLIMIRTPSIFPG
jgi:hypothetical protein